MELGIIFWPSLVQTTGGLSFSLPENPARRPGGVKSCRSAGVNGTALARSRAIWQALSMRIRQLSHSTYSLQYHLVWGTKYRKKILKDYVKKELIRSFKETIKKYPTLYLTTVNTDQDHVHLQLEIPPNIAISDAVEVLKSNSSSALKKKFKFIRGIYIYADGIWSVGYFVSSIGLNEGRIRRYIEYQGKKEEPRTTTLFD